MISVKVPYNKFLVESDPDMKSRVGDFTIDTEWGNGKMENAPQVGSIVCVPHSGYRNEYGDEIIPQVGDQVLFHYLASCDGESYKDGQSRSFYSIKYDQIYCIVRDGDLYPLHDLVFCDPIAESAFTEDGLLKGIWGDEQNLIQVTYVSSFCAKRGIEKGMTLYRKGLNYYNEINGHKYVVVHYGSVEYFKKELSAQANVGDI